MCAKLFESTSGLAGAIVTLPSPFRTKHSVCSEARWEQEAELMLRSLYGSAHPQGDTVSCPDTLKLAAALQDGCVAAPGISSAVYCISLVI